jgi:AmiR/NasT family two-component response regulator
LDSLFAGKPTVLLLNFPRTQDITAANRRGIHEVVSKPFQPNDLKYAIEVSINRHHVASADQILPTSSISRRPKAGTTAGS